MKWNWTQQAWPQFIYDEAHLKTLEDRFLLSSGEVIGAVRHIRDEERNLLSVELLSDEAVKTSEIEGEMLDRLSVQSLLRRQFGLDADNCPVKPQERGIAEMMVDVYETCSGPLNHETLFRWHGMLMTGNRHLETIGRYRTHDDAMQIVSGRLDQPTVHYEAPPSRQVPAEMEAFMDWFNRSAPSGESPLPALTRAGLGHLYFESIHPFEDGNGRIGRALAEKSLAQNIGQPSLIWLVYFAETVLEAQQTTLERVAFFIAKAHSYDRFRDLLNERQEKVIARMFREGPMGFKGGLSAENYISITRSSRATATRDLHDLVEKGALKRAGERRYTRYALNLPAIK
ncbi:MULTISPECIES: Fic family protein [unclassified Rhizobium]|uniref:Fic family protein n=1 Tax=unclassified Rhizobium TaxID=2613769 RepID=UPI0010540A08|nr:MULTISPECIES: Fic family protein [unclassified Rhizobium]MBB3393742.1 Fic family protein [Rhizobium sp. BK060]TCM81659.1 Fic family protein [Rhizobium sp. BK068]